MTHHPNSHPTPAATSAPSTARVIGLGQAGTQHYENFPVASLLCPPALRPAVLAIYHFARTADDLADEGDATAAQRLADLHEYREALTACATGAPHNSPRWDAIFHPLAQAIARHRLPLQLLHDLISAFEQDVRHTAAQSRYRDTTALLDYCRLSANPVGRLLLHLYGVTDPRALAQSDQICSALQLINFWQDLSVDLPRQRHYLPEAALRAHGVDPADLTPALRQSPAAEAMIAALCQEARALMVAGAPLVHRLPGRTGWELRLVVQGGLLILDRMAALQHRTWHTRVRVGSADVPRLLWRAWRMSPR